MIEEVENSMQVVEVDVETIRNYTEQVYRCHSVELDTIVQRVKDILTKVRQGELKTYSDDYIELQCVSLAVTLYDVIDALEDLGSKQDLSKLKYDEEYASIYRSLEVGTIPDKEAISKSQTYYQKMTHEIYKRAYNKLKKKVDTAFELHASLKKVLDHRMKRIEVFRRDTTYANMNREIRNHEGGNDNA